MKTYTRARGLPRSLTPFNAPGNKLSLHNCLNNKKTSHFFFHRFLSPRPLLNLPRARINMRKRKERRFACSLCLRVVFTFRINSREFFFLFSNEVNNIYRCAYPELGKKKEHSLELYKFSVRYRDKNQPLASISQTGRKHTRNFSRFSDAVRVSDLSLVASARTQMIHFSRYFPMSYINRRR